VQLYRKTYQHFIQPVSIENLESDLRILPPVFKRLRGRPKTKRVRKGAWKRKATKCSKCHQTGHSKRTCRFAPAVHGRRQRAYDREPELVLSDNSEDRQRQIDIEVDNWRHRRDIERLERLRAQRQGFEENCSTNTSNLSDADSELSVLASSLFSGMEGDIMDGVEMGSGAIQVGDSEVVNSEVVDSEIVDSEIVDSEIVDSEMVDSEVRVSRYGRKYTKHRY
jgi:hypothetical protein